MDRFEEWLLALSPVEEELKKYYKEHKSLADFRYLSRLISASNDDDPYEILFSPIDKDLLFASNSGDQNESTWFSNNEDVTIRSHLCYTADNWHKHRFIEACYVLSGEAKESLSYSDGAVETISLKTGDFLIIPPDMKHENMVVRDGRLINILIRPSVLKQKIGSLMAEDQTLFRFFLYTLYENDSPNYLLFHSDGCDDVRRMVIELVKETVRHSEYSSQAQVLYLGLLLTYIQRDCSDQISFSKRMQGGAALVPRILNYMDQEYSLTGVSEVAIILGSAHLT